MVFVGKKKEFDTNVWYERLKDMHYENLGVDWVIILK